MSVTPAEQELLLQVARDAIVAHVKGGATSPRDFGALERRRGGAFVTIHNRGQLRGCIGHIDSPDVLVRVVARCAVAACSADPRFPPVTASELTDLQIELSLLGVSEGAPLCILFAATYPSRTAAIVLVGGFARETATEDYPFGRTQAEHDAGRAEIEANWGGPVGQALRAPSRAGDDRFAQNWARYLRLGASPADLEAIAAAAAAALEGGAALTREELSERIVADTGSAHLADVLRSGWGTLFKPLAWTK